MYIVRTEGNLKVESYGSLTKRGQENTSYGSLTNRAQENKQGSGLRVCWDGVAVGCETDMPDSYARGFTRSAGHSHLCHLLKISSLP